jgi:hypothetical protein
MFLQMTLQWAHLGNFAGLVLELQLGVENSVFSCVASVRQSVLIGVISSKVICYKLNFFCFFGSSFENLLFASLMIGFPPTTTISPRGAVFSKWVKTCRVVPLRFLRVILIIL